MFLFNMEFNSKRKYIPALILICLAYGSKEIWRDDDRDWRVRPKNKLWKKLLWWCLHNYDSGKGVYINGDIYFDFTMEDILIK